jgi:hypothetical protein
MLLKLLRRLSDEYDADMVCQEGDVHEVFFAEARVEYRRRMGREPRTDFGEAALESRADLMYRTCQELGVVEAVDGRNGCVRVYPERARVYCELAESWKPEV